MKIAVYFAEGYEELEALSVVDVLRRGEVEVIMVGVTGTQVKSARNISIQMDCVIDELNHDAIDMIVLPGGVPGIYNLEKNELVLENIKSFKSQGKWLAAICAAPSILGKCELLIGEKATCYPGNEKYLKQCEYINEGTVVSHKIITSKGVGTALEFAFTILKVLKGKGVADTVKEAMLVRTI
ncbi:DJ-1 family glyoxalase III [Cellulosilyticum sp. I15G10I2]|uniref:DJ-1 family glyoxalase III n=1 Tax=Cellulosilyticum sp. I15G10I2 TaxID=1892843 RepID=UPI00085C63BD|nr:DJ-1 family glyoxalase III [Cellulosilyticum sp. I15G10I2]